MVVKMQEFLRKWLSWHHFLVLMAPFSYGTIFFLNITRFDFHGEWNYMLAPRQL